MKLLLLYSDIAFCPMSDEEKTTILGYSEDIQKNIQDFDLAADRSRSSRDLNILIRMSKEFVDKELIVQKKIEEIAENCFDNLPSRRSLRGSPEKPQQSPSGMGYFARG